MEKKMTYGEQFNLMMEFEEGDISQEDCIRLFQNLIDTGMAWTLQGFYGRTAQNMIEAGYCHRKGE